jgi:hypothetical protein
MMRIPRSPALICPPGGADRRTGATRGNHVDASKLTAARVSGGAGGFVVTGGVEDKVSGLEPAELR